MEEEERGRAYSFRAQSRVHFGKVVFRNTMAGGTSWPWKINGPIYEPPSKRTVNKISAMSIHFPRTFNHPLVQRGYHSRWLLRRLVQIECFKSFNSIFFTVSFALEIPTVLAFLH